MNDRYLDPADLEPGRETDLYRHALTFQPPAYPWQPTGHADALRTAYSLAGRLGRPDADSRAELETRIEAFSAATQRLTAFVEAARLSDPTASEQDDGACGPYAVDDGEPDLMSAAGAWQSVLGWAGLIGFVVVGAWLLAWPWLHR